MFGSRKCFASQHYIAPPTGDTMVNRFFIDTLVITRSDSLGKITVYIGDTTLGHRVLHFYGFDGSAGTVTFFDDESQWGETDHVGMAYYYRVDSLVYYSYWAHLAYYAADTSHSL